MMLSIPARLLDSPFVEVLYRDKHVLFLKKELSASALDRQSFISMPAIVWIEKGSQKIQSYDGDQEIFNPESLAFYRKGIYTINDLVSQNGLFRSYLLFLSEERLREALPHQVIGGKPDPPLQPFYQSGCPILVSDFFRQLYRQLRLLKEPSPRWMHVKIQEFFLLLEPSEDAARLFEFLFSLDQKKNRSIKQLMENHFDKPLSIADYAYLSGRSESTFRREFKQRFGLPPGQWLIRKRLEKARQLLRNGDYPVSSVALEVGYENVSHFIQSFKSHFQQTPAEFQQGEN